MMVVSIGLERPRLLLTTMAELWCPPIVSGSVGNAVGSVASDTGGGFEFLPYPVSKRTRANTRCPVLMGTLTSVWTN